MQLTRFTDYTLRTLIAVGVDTEGGVTIADIAARYGISKNHLMKVVQHLARAGYLETVRGRGGGLRLAVPAERIGLGAIVREVEGFEIVPCFGAERRAVEACAIAPACVLKGALGRALTAFLDVLDEYTLADLIGPDRRLRRLLALDGDAAGAA
jgi:Rrf2 family nitric oxide-sensitive transcriptional repressor